MSAYRNATSESSVPVYRGPSDHHQPCNFDAGDASFYTLQKSINDALRFLRRSQLGSGEFNTLIATKQDMSDGITDSSPFTTTFVLYALQYLPDIEVRDLKEQALTFLRHEKSFGDVWRYYSTSNYKHVRVPPDLDDTACASFALRQGGFTVSNEWAFRSLRDEQGRFLTWLVPQKASRTGCRAVLLRSLNEIQARFFRQLAAQPASAPDSRLLVTEYDPVPVDDVDPAVNANVILFLGESDFTRQAIDYLISCIKAGSDTGFSLYYRDDVTLLYLTARAHLHSAPSLREVKGEMLSRIEAHAQSQTLYGSARSAAMAASILLTLEYEGPLLDDFINAVLALQQDDGAWKEDLFYSGPNEFWGSRELTTAFCLEALARYLQRSQGHEGGEAQVGSEGLQTLDSVLSGPDGVDADWYLAQYPDAAGYASAAAHYARYGWRERKDPNPNFSTQWYLTEYPDVADAKINPLVHYLRHGRAEGRAPVEPEARWNPDGVLTGPDGVDAAWYLSRYPDVVGYASPAAHYAQLGWRQGKDPNPNFSTEWYLTAYPDIEAAGANPLVHYLRHGRAEGRLPVEPEARWNPDGVLTGNEGVDAGWYLARYPEASGSLSAAAHYAHFGWREGKDPNPNFSTQWYLKTYPDIAAAGVNPLVHYLRHGRAEGRASRSSVKDLVRARDWWPSKIQLVMAVAFATALQAGLPIASSLAEIAILVAAIVVCAIYVSIINDLTDAAQDKISGKRNITDKLPRSAVIAIMFLCIAAGGALCIWLSPSSLATGLYLGSWVAFSLYSFRPFRLKERTYLGVLADASGAHVFPALLSVVAVYQSEQLPVDIGWALFVLVWSLSFGLRSIILHQMTDESNDARAKVSTYVRHVGRARALFVSERMLLPLEVLAFAMMATYIGSIIVVTGAIAYFTLIIASGGLTVAPGYDGSVQKITPYYSVLLPLTLLVAAAAHDRVDLLVLLLFSIIFGTSILAFVRYILGVINESYLPERPVFRMNGAL
ncbi:UbiA family prenyltransferase [Mangrovicella endophytica]|uniref:UbiA family prenyltransferase n=1 Tax=Mangrovicella endophytica TaxID=2066697 RepID=UPI000C9EAEC9|nr:UbiA family prenyltransferase [Mangrovicella endophytica]